MCYPTRNTTPEAPVYSYRPQKECSFANYPRTTTTRIAKLPTIFSGTFSSKSTRFNLGNWCLQWRKAPKRLQRQVWWRSWASTRRCIRRIGKSPSHFRRLQLWLRNWCSLVNPASLGSRCREFCTMSLSLKFNN